MSESLKLDVHVAPMRPMRGSPAQGPGDEPMWSPMSSTLIRGGQDAVLVDTLVTNDQVDALADWVKTFGTRLRAIYITHGHSDHWIGLARLLERFPGARGLATQRVRDTEHSTILHVPEIDAVVAGDVVYNQVHMMMGEADAAARAAWIASLDAIETLAPQIVVSGHKRVGTPDRAITIEQSREYLCHFSRVAQEHETVGEIVKAMLALHPDRDNPRVVWHSARIEVARRFTT